MTSMRAGDAYWFPNEHLTFVISDPDPATGEVVVVNASHWEENRDQSCVLEIGDHADVTKKSIIFYTFAQILTSTQQEQFMRIAQSTISASPDLLQRIQEGADDSRFLAPKFKKLVREHCARERAKNRAGNPT